MEELRGWLVVFRQMARQRELGLRVGEGRRLGGRELRLRVGIPWNVPQFAVCSYILFMDLEVPAQPWACVFKPIEQLMQARHCHAVQLENCFQMGDCGQVMLSLAGPFLLLSAAKGHSLQPFAGVEVSFELKFQVLYQVPKNVRSGKRGLRLLIDGHSVSFFASAAVLEAWSYCLSQQLNQLGFHEAFRPLRKLGKGSFASVYEVERVADGRRFAVKAFAKQSCYQAKHGRESLLNELDILRTLAPEADGNLLRLESVYESENSIYLVLQLLAGGQLFHRIQQRNGCFSAEEVREFMAGLLGGLARMHRQRIMHRDLKPENIMLRSAGSMAPVIVDFGLATHADLEKYLFYRCGTPGYVAPEIISLTESRHVEPQCDVFSAGAIFHLLLTRRPLFPGSRYDEVYRSNKQMQFRLEGEAYADIDADALSLLSRMLLADPAQRISAEEALRHCYFCGLEEEKVSSPVATSAGARRMSVLQL